MGLPVVLDAELESLRHVGSADPVDQRQGHVDPGGRGRGGVLPVEDVALLEGLGSELGQHVIAIPVRGRLAAVEQAGPARMREPVQTDVVQVLVWSAAMSQSRSGLSTPMCGGLAGCAGDEDDVRVRDVGE